MINIYTRILRFKNFQITKVLDKDSWYLGTLSLVRKTVTKLELSNVNECLKIATQQYTMYRTTFPSLLAS